MTNGKVGIFCGEQHGDIALCSSVLKYKNILWPNKDIIWYCNLRPEKSTYLDMLKYNDAISEIRDWPEEDFRTLKSCDGQLILERRRDFESMKDLDVGYFPAPWAALPNARFSGVNYADIPRIIYGIDSSWEWHPYLGFSDEEKDIAGEFCSKLPYEKTIMLETQLRSAGDFRMPDEAIKETMRLCRKKFGKCNFIFASLVDHSKYVDDIGVVSCPQFTVRQTALIHNYCDLFICVSSGISVAASCWGNKPVPRVELCHSSCSYSAIANGPVVSVIADDWPVNKMIAGVVQAVELTLNKI